MAWDTNTNIMNFPYYTDVKILGFSIVSTIKQSTRNTWSNIVCKIRAQARDAYCRDLCLSQRILYIHAFLLAKVLYTAQVFPAPDECIRQLNSAISWCLWQGETYRAPLSTLNRRKEHGRWELLDVAAKSRALLIDRLRSQGLKGTITAVWLQKWDLLKPSKTPRKWKGYRQLWNTYAF